MTKTDRLWAVRRLLAFGNLSSDEVEKAAELQYRLIDEIEAERPKPILGCSSKNRSKWEDEENK